MAMALALARGYAMARYRLALVLTYTFLGPFFKHEITKSHSSSLSGKQTDLNDK